MGSTIASNKDIVRDPLARLPDQVTLSNIAKEIELVAAVRQGIAEIDRGQSVSIDKVAEELPTWIIR
jgi:predicted transcriptional regulator